MFNTPCVEGYGNTFKNGKLALCEEVPYYSETWTDNLQPATKEQRELLFAKMKEAGYVWDAENKELKKIEQKPTDKIKPKFKDGDCVVDNCGYVWKIEGILNQFYILEGIEGGESRPTIDWVDKTFHLWTVQDAKDGDVLTVDDERPFIFKGCLDPNHPDSPVAYCGIDTEGYFCVGGSKFNHWWTDERVHPATKEQRDLLFAKMEEEYKWDADKKELKKIEQKLDDEIELKFRVGDCVVNKLSDVWRINSFDKKNYQVSDGKGNYNYFPISKQDEMHLWTIKDAKDGDVLAFYSEYRGNKMVQVGIIEKYVGKHGGCSNTFKIYVGVNWDNNLQIGEYMGCSDMRPATKEQRDALMKVMVDAGYAFDFEKKELKNIEQKSVIKMKTPEESLGISSEEYNKIVDECIYGDDKPAWSEEDNYGFDCVAQCITQATLSSDNKQDLDICKCARNWFNSIKHRLTNT